MKPCKNLSNEICFYCEVLMLAWKSGCMCAYMYERTRVEEREKKEGSYVCYMCKIFKRRMKQNVVSSENSMTDPIICLTVPMGIKNVWHFQKSNERQTTWLCSGRERRIFLNYFFGVSLFLINYLWTCNTVIAIKDSVPYFCFFSYRHSKSYI